MSLLDYFRSKKTQNSAKLAKERLQIIVAHERSQRDTPDYLPQMQQDILEVIRKYVKIDIEHISVQLDQKGDNLSVLELNIMFPDHDDKANPDDKKEEEPVAP
ncbi:cell division topological specificity factor MinE [Oceanisphaera arctica]|uniref:Cell division topological specificity factor n=1 Tax=Oceanisphaera arctica TaxID=641510 RepID=A0A2P5TQP6_9GAMM|nr:cell division topological specificity factor MinE [Oceanisphaera arctica]PPL18045.1 cell division topological specificity factor MinE [Oceanisphaera arctica]GHA09442.1 cell division topological specificity factor [Oceanisphaera arctica]